MMAIMSALFGLLGVFVASFGNAPVLAGVFAALAVSNAIIHLAERRS